MAGWLKRVDGSGLESFKTQQEQLNKSSFDEFLSVFLQESFGNSCFRPLPPMLGNGESVDLLKLYLIVRKRGGYVEVSENCLWDSVANECGFDSSLGLALKLVYAKYLHDLSSCLQRAIKNKDSKSGVNDNSSNSGCFGEGLMDLESNFDGLLSEISPPDKKKGGVYTNMDFVCDAKLSNTNENLGFAKKNGGIECVDENKIEIINETRNDNDEYRAVASDGCDGISVEGGDIVSNSIVGKEHVRIRKRRREFPEGMLKWVNGVAKDPCDPAIGSLPERSKWKSYPNDKVWKQVLLVREAMFLKGNVDSSDENCASQKRQRMHPFMYDDLTNSERLRCSQRLVSAKDSSKKSRGQTSSLASSSSGRDEDYVDAQSDFAGDSLPDYLASHRRPKRIPIGPQSQADVPEWTGETSESDSKWLGTKIWPLEKGEQNKNLIERERIGKGKQDSCGCQFPGSRECVRFHVSEKRTRLRLELGPAFSRWKFDNMGEEVACSWSKEDKKKFHNTVKSNPSEEGKDFWKELLKSFPKKSPQSLASYYFNVFVLKQRGDQNRTTPHEINSDEEDARPEAEAAKPNSIFHSTPKKTHSGFK